MALLALGASLSILGAYLLINWLPFDSFRIAWDSRQIGILALHYMTLALPFFFGGTAIGLLLDAFSKIAGRVYGVNLIASTHEPHSLLQANLLTGHHKADYREKEVELSIDSIEDEAEFLSEDSADNISAKIQVPMEAEWAKRFFNHFLAGKSLGQAFLDLRREFYYDHNNVMGLLYALYCDGDTQVVPGLQMG